MAIGIQYSKEGKEIISKFEDLTPWDKAEMMRYLADHVMTEDEIEKYFIEGSGYVHIDDIDLVQEVVNNGQEEEVLAEMNDDDICQYLLDSYYDNGKGSIEYMLERAHWDDSAKAINDMDRSCLYDILKAIKNNHPDLLKDIINWLFEGK